MTTAPYTWGDDSGRGALAPPDGQRLQSLLSVGAELLLLVGTERCVFDQDRDQTIGSEVFKLRFSGDVSADSLLPPSGRSWSDHTFNI